MPQPPLTKVKEKAATDVCRNFDLKDEARQLEFAGQAVLGRLFQRV